MNNERLVWFNRGKIDPVILRYDRTITHCYFCSAIFTAKNPRMLIDIPVYPSETYYIAGKFSSCAACASQIDKSFIKKVRCPVCEEDYEITISEEEYRSPNNLYMCCDCIYSFYGKRILSRYRRICCEICDAPYFLDISVVEPCCNFCLDYGKPKVTYSEQFAAVVYEGDYGRILVHEKDGVHQALVLVNNTDLFSAILQHLWSRK